MKLDDARVSLMNFGLDYDDTFDRDPGLWRLFVQVARDRGHSVFVTTARHPERCKDIEANWPGLEIVASGGGSKRAACEAAGIEIDIWIDDMPELIP